MGTNHSDDGDDRDLHPEIGLSPEVGSLLHLDLYLAGDNWKDPVRTAVVHSQGPVRLTHSSQHEVH